MNVVCVIQVRIFARPRTEAQLVKLINNLNLLYFPRLSLSVCIPPCVAYPDGLFELLALTRCHDVSPQSCGRIFMSLLI